MKTSSILTKVILACLCLLSFSCDILRGTDKQVRKSLDYTIFSEVCRVLTEKNKEFKLKKELVNIRIYEDWATAEMMLDTMNTFNERELSILSELNEEQLKDLLSTQDPSIFPLSEKFNLIDSIDFFSNSFHVSLSNVLFIVEKKKEDATSSINLESISTKGNQMRIDFSIQTKKSIESFDFYFKYSDDCQALEFQEYKYDSFRRKRNCFN